MLGFGLPSRIGEIMADIKADEWFKQDYFPSVVDGEEKEDVTVDDEVLSLHEAPMDSEKDPESPIHINAFELIGMSSSLDLSGFFEKQEAKSSRHFHPVTGRVTVKRFIKEK